MPASSHRVRSLTSVGFLVGLLGVVAATSGCVAWKGSRTALDLMGGAEFTFDACASKAGDPNCSSLGSSNLEARSDVAGQVLLGLQIAVGLEAPAVIDASASTIGPLDLSPSYTAELSRLRPPGPGLKWIGYISKERTFTAGQLGTAKLRLTNTPLPDGSPNPTTLNYTLVLGSRGVVPPDHPAARPVACGPALNVVSVENLTICEDTSTSSAGPGLVVRDFGFITPASVTVQAGQTATIPVSGKLLGAADPGINFALAPSTTVPGALATTNVPTLAPPSNSTTQVVMSVAVPPSTPPGTYQATLTGTLGNGTARSATGTIVVAATGTTTVAGTPTVGPLGLRFSVPKRFLKSNVVGRGFPVTVRAARDVVATVTVTQRRSFLKKPITVTKRVLVTAPSTVVRFRSPKLLRGALSVKVVTNETTVSGGGSLA